MIQDKSGPIPKAMTIIPIPTNSHCVPMVPAMKTESLTDTVVDAGERLGPRAGKPHGRHPQAAEEQAHNNQEILLPSPIRYPSFNCCTPPKRSNTASELKGRK